MNLISITLTYVFQDLILPDQTNRVVRTRMLRGVGEAPCEGRSYPDISQLQTSLTLDGIGTCEFKNGTYSIIYCCNISMLQATNLLAILLHKNWT